MLNILGDSVNSVYRQVLRAALAEPTAELHKDTCVEFIGTHYRIRQPSDNLIASRKRNFNYRYMVAEMLWNLCYSYDIDVLKYVFPNVERFCADQPFGYRDISTWAYGPRMSTMLPSVLKELEKEDGSRRAVVTLEHPHSMAHVVGGGTPPCLVSIQWLVRDRKLTQLVYMRSNDIWRGLPLDLYQFTAWQQMIAAHLCIELGDYHHFVGSTHMYARDRPYAIEFMVHESCAVRSEEPIYTDLKNILRNQGTDILNMMRNVERPHNYSGPLAVYHNNSTELMPEEFAWLKNNGYGVW